ncbi:MAG: DUF1569 domain-containing protein [Crocinitomicaceae bacterium]|nr:DUF1569 domain-containing protein [Crocinitomicaceae bacterium]
MEFIQLDLEGFLTALNKLEATTSPKWGSMNAQRMVEHLTEGINMSMGIGAEAYQTLLIPEEQLPKMQAFLDSEEPMPRNFKAPFAPAEYELRNEELELAIDEFVETWLDYEEHYETNPTATYLHPYYGVLDKKGWDRVHQKHFTHHFQQFGVE